MTPASILFELSGNCPYTTWRLQPCNSSRRGTQFAFARNKEIILTPQGTMSQKHYSKAPIVEAIVDIQVKMAEDFSHNSFDAAHSRLSDRFPVKSPMKMVEMRLEAGANTGESSHSSSSTDIGLRLTNKDNSRVIQLRTNGFTYSHMPPYTSWEVLRDEAYQAWLIFVATCKPKTVVRCALRFVNRVDIPKPSIELHEYFHLYPEIPKGVPQDMNGMFMQLQMPQPDIEGMAIINQAVVDPTTPGTMSVLLDFDLFQVRDYAPNDEAIWHLLDKLRIRKNELFEACITDETRRLIN